MHRVQSNDITNQPDIRIEAERDTLDSGRFL
jgi:hypothetical protein